MNGRSNGFTRRQFLGAAGGLGGVGAMAALAGPSPVGASMAGRGRHVSPSTTKMTLPPCASWRKPDSLPDPSRAAGSESIPEIDHIVVLMQENHSFDNYFGMLGRGDGFTLNAKGKPTNSNPYKDGFLEVYHETNTCQPGGVDQSWNNSHLQYDGGTNQGFANAHAGIAAMGYFNQGDIPFYYSMARQFPICDRYFCSVLGQTYPNRRFLMAGTAYGLVNSDISQIGKNPPNGTIFDRLDTHGIGWKNYNSDVSTLAIIISIVTENPSKIVGVREFYTDAAAGTLPSVSFVDSNNFTQDEENPQDLQLGESFVAGIVGAVMSGPAWEKTMLILTYDEHGGWYDHVPPPPAIPPDDIPPMITVPPDQPGSYDRYGFRVPVTVVSGRSKRDFVSHTVYDHTSVLKTIETKWNLPALTYRDANANHLFDCLELGGRAPFAEPPTLAKPANTTGVSVCTEQLQNPATSKEKAVALPDPPASVFTKKRPSA